MTENNQALQTQIAELTSEKEQLTEDITNLRARANLSQQNWVKERDDLLMQEAQVREEFESAKQAMQDWEVLAMEERSVREGLGDRVAELEEQLSNQREAYERAASDRDTQSVTVDGLQRALHDIQEGKSISLSVLEFPADLATRSPQNRTSRTGREYSNPVRGAPKAAQGRRGISGSITKRARNYTPGVGKGATF